MTEYETIQAWLNQSVIDLKANYNSLGLRASGNWERQLETQQEQERGKVTAKILGADYSYYLENGRGVTSPAKRGRLYGIMLQWIENKGIIPQGKMSKKTLAWLIARKIDTQGIKVPNAFNQGGLISGIMTKERINILLDQLKGVSITNVRSDIIKTLQS